MKVNYFYITDEIHGRPIAEIATSGIQGLKEEFHPAKMAANYAYTFIDIVLENESDNIEENEEAIRLKELIDIPQDIIEEIITDQRPRADSYPDFYLILFKSLTVEKRQTKISLDEHQVGVLIRDNVIFSVHKKISKMPYEEIFKRFYRHPMKIAKGGVTYFVTTYLDLMIDQIYKVLDVWSHSIDEYEKQIIEQPEVNLLYDILELRHKLLDLVKILQADREIITSMKNAVTLFNTEDIPPELDDHIKHLLDETDIIRNLLTDVTNMYYNADSAILNSTMKRFTFITSLILMPSLIAGIFGMNNNSGNTIDFYLVLLSMVVIVIVMFLYFKKKKYI